MKRAWDPKDAGVRAVTDEDGVAALQLDPGAARQRRRPRPCRCAARRGLRPSPSPPRATSSPRTRPRWRTTVALQCWLPSLYPGFVLPSRAARTRARRARGPRRRRRPRRRAAGPLGMRLTRRCACACCRWAPSGSRAGALPGTRTQACPVLELTGTGTGGRRGAAGPERGADGRGGCVAWALAKLGTGAPSPPGLYPRGGRGKSRQRRRASWAAEAGGGLGRLGDGGSRREPR